MIDYHAGGWGVLFIFSGWGVLPRACVWGIGAAVMTLIVHITTDNVPGMFAEFDGVASYFKSYLTFLIFLLVFRTQVAHSRLNEGVSLLLKLRGHWCGAFASILNSCSRSEEKAKEVRAFQQHLLRLMSIMHSVAMQEIAEIPHIDLDILGDDGIDPTSMEFLSYTTDKVQVVQSWITAIVYEAERKDIIQASPPILGRIYQELANGMIATTQAWKIREVPFPFPHAQMLTVLLLFTTFIMPFISLEVSNKFFASFLTFLAVAAMWSVNYTAQELEGPFGDDVDDFPVWKMQDNFNRSIKVLVSPMCLQPPSFNCDIAKTIMATTEQMEGQFGLTTLGLVQLDVDTLRTGSAGGENGTDLFTLHETSCSVEDTVTRPPQSQVSSPYGVECLRQIQGFQKNSALGGRGSLLAEGGAPVAQRSEGGSTAESDGRGDRPPVADKQSDAGDCSSNAASV